MPRRGLVQHRESHPDLKYNDILIAKTISIIMRGGKKCTAENVFYGALDIVKEKSSADPVKIFKAAIDNIKPLVEVKSRRVGGASYQVPVDIRPVRRNALAIRWLVSFARERSGKNMAERLAFEIIDAANGTGSAIKKKEDTHRMAEANKAFAHYRW
ncbi:MAG: 30S ribosomal protein S7 [Nitrospirae bacterium RIFCSPLOW2_12_42_9]|nr:MAG: 30S ribosomal protein S7 [Nitrospirae bacterium GWA2_42_11]OGW55520.1 MAG: 30S ribosomal protein S7 [Nitrospirae bacterium RIFCSPHIGHO2_02_FULL_42_12]OGW57825.1 MAG: 30S ribosomal protein S7 [Nitrospirae bacterium RIFCSPLOW2_12_42_9]HAS16339.1 30S ribosomal protein S7 [Nitrospiraceae bacterium]HBI24830.1 30S ribosomal protein S7 [Nitrospiraceae bacterium]